MGSPAVTAISDALAGVATLGLDTAIVIYFAERNATYVTRAREIFRRMDADQIAACTSVLTLTEVLTHPRRTSDLALEQEYRRILLGSTLRLLNTTQAIAISAADLRARYNLRTPDAIQIATALDTGCEAFFTNDLGLRRVTKLRILVLDELTL